MDDSFTLHLFCRYKNVVAAGVVVGQWTEADDMMILAKHSDVGNKWVRIASFLPGRPENSVKNRYHSLLRRAMKGDQYPIVTARKAGGTSFLSAIEAKLGGAAVRKATAGAAAAAAASSSASARSAAGGSKRRRSPTAAASGGGGGRGGKVPDTGSAESAAAAIRLQQQAQAQQHAALQQLHMQAVMASGGGGSAEAQAAAAAMAAAGPYSVQDIAAATNAAMQAADGMGEKLVSMDTETQIAMIAAAMTGRAEVEPAVTEQLKRCRGIWTQFLHVQTAMAANQYSLGGYQMALSMPPGLPTQGMGHTPSSMAGSSPAAAASGGMQLLHSTQPANTASVGVLGGAGGQHKVVRDALGRDLSITIPPMGGVSAGTAAGMGFQLAGPMSSSASPTFMFSPGNGNTPLNLASLMHGGLLSAQSRGDADGAHAAGTPTAFFMTSSDGDGSGHAQ